MYSCSCVPFEVAKIDGIDFTRLELSDKNVHWDWTHIVWNCRLAIEVFNDVVQQNFIDVKKLTLQQMNFFSDFSEIPRETISVLCCDSRRNKFKHQESKKLTPPFGEEINHDFHFLGCQFHVKEILLNHVIKHFSGKSTASHHLSSVSVYIPIKQFKFKQINFIVKWM